MLATMKTARFTGGVGWSTVQEISTRAGSVMSSRKASEFTDGLMAASSQVFGTKTSLMDSEYPSTPTQKFHLAYTRMAKSLAC